MSYCHGDLYQSGGGGIRGYFYTLLVASVCTSVCSMVASDGFEKYIKYIASVICVAVMVSPFRDVDFSQIMEEAEKEISEYQTDNELFYKTAGELTEERATQYINETVFNKFGIKPISTHIEIDWGEEEPVIQFIKVYLPADSDISAVKNYLQDELGGEVEVIAA